MVQYDSIKTKVDLNPIIRKGMVGVSLEKYDEHNFEIEILYQEEFIIEYIVQATYMVSDSQIEPEN